MTTTLGTMTGWLALVCVASGGCATETKVQAEPLPSQTAGAGGSGGSGTAGGGARDAGVAGLGGASGGDAGDAGGAAGGLGCDHPRPGPRMVEVPRGDGRGTFCIDTTEVTQAQYAEFLAAENKPKLHEGCLVMKYEPDQDESPEGYGGCRSLPGSGGRIFTPDLTPNHPVYCVTWCAADAYCRWAGKRLCGRTPGTRLGDASPEKSEWTQACSNGGKTRYPYGDTERVGPCWTGAERLAAKESGAEVEGYLPGVHPYREVGKGECRGLEPPYDQLVDMVGNVDEWEDRCDSSQGLTCAIRALGGACAKAYSKFPGSASNAGIRCCADP